MKKMKRVKKIILENKYLSWLQFFSNWLMQGIFHADLSEKLYKVTFTLFFSVLFFFIHKFYYGLPLSKNILISFFYAHSINWIINCNFFVILVHRIKWLKTSKVRLFEHLTSIQYRLKNMSNKQWLQYSVSHGGICEGTLNNHSDIDVTLIRNPGFKNMILAILFYVKEKKYADIKGIPLDIFISDSPNDCIKKSKGQKNPIVLFDPQDKVKFFYPYNMIMNIQEAMTLNNVK